jgi:hypothetical protein
VRYHLLQLVTATAEKQSFSFYLPRVLRFVDCPEVVSTFFKTSNAIDTHNQLRQDLLQLEKKWLTKNPFFRLSTTLVGISVTDAFLLSNHHKIINNGSGSHDDKKISIQ